MLSTAPNAAPGKAPPGHAPSDPSQTPGDRDAGTGPGPRAPRRGAWVGRSAGLGVFGIVAVHMKAVLGPLVATRDASHPRHTRRRRRFADLGVMGIVAMSLRALPFLLLLFVRAVRTVIRAAGIGIRFVIRAADVGVPLAVRAAGIGIHFARVHLRPHPDPEAHDQQREAGRSGASDGLDRSPNRGRRLVTWRSALGAGLVCFGIWSLLDAPTLLNSARGSPLGARRTVSIDILRPISAASSALGLSHVVGAADRAIGRTGNGVVKGGVMKVVGPQVHAARGHHGRSSGHGGRGSRAVPAVGAATGVAARAADGLPPFATPTTATPLRVLSIGDSLGVDFGQTFVNDLAGTGVVNALLDAHIDTGLSRPDYFNWPTELSSDLARFHPQAVVVFLGANDPQDFSDGGKSYPYGTPAWDQAYGTRVAQLMQSATASGARVLWVGMPPMSDPALTTKMQSLDTIFQREAQQVPGVSYYSAWPVLSDPNGGYAAYLSDSSGNEVQVREPDGTHISPGGAERLSRAVIGAMDHEWGLGLQP